MMYVQVIFLIILSHVMVNGLPNKCADAKNCAECMTKGAECSWCFSTDFQDRSQGPQFRCATRAKLMERGCPADKMEYLKNENTTVRDDKPIETEHKTVQLYPQSIKLKLRLNSPLKIKFGFRQAKNYPVDLYYLTDLSYSMYKHLSVVSSQASTIAETMKTITNKFRMGFGAFVDKPVFPFIDPREESMRNPCSSVSESAPDCDPPFGYKHILSLTTDIKKFSKMINQTKPSGNLDGPEGGLDALLQASLCPDILGWDKNARKIVLYTTDAGFHIAGDGKLGGLVERFEEQCAMGRKKSSEPYYYEKSTQLDYPSVGQVARVLEKKGIGVIFAILESLKPLYENFVKILPSATVGVLDKDSSNIVKLIKDNYDKISSTVTLNIDGIKDFKYTLKTRCKPDGPFEEVRTCRKLPLGGHIEYELTLEAEKCLKEPKKIIIRPANLDESLTIEASTLCDCQHCDSVSQAPSAKQCGGNGDLVCGACKCKSGRSGDFCECSSSTSESSLIDKCINPSDPEKKLCSGRGRCECGTCKCAAARYNGTYCECDLMACPRASDDNTVCGGPTRGTCSCNGTCICNPAYHKKACDCLKSNEQCMSGNLTCSNKGTCDCGLCVCDLNYMGLTCGEAQGSDGPLCINKKVKKCVECIHKKETYVETSLNCTDVCSQSSYVDEAKVKMVDDHNTDDMSSLCVLYDAQECRIYFTYRWEDRVSSNRKAHIRIQRASQCPSRVSKFAIVGGVVGGIVLIGLFLLIIWKTVVTISDKQEVAKFQKELDNAKWEMEENPIFKEPVTTVNNPLYNAHGE